MQLAKRLTKAVCLWFLFFFMWTNLCYALVIQENNYTIVRMFFLPNLSCHLQHATSSVKTMAPVLFRMVWLGAYVQETGVEGCVITAPSATATPVLGCQPCVMSVNKDTTWTKKETNVVSISYVRSIWKPFMANQMKVGLGRSIPYSRKNFIGAIFLPKCC